MPGVVARIQASLISISPAWAAPAARRDIIEANSNGRMALELRTRRGTLAEDGGGTGLSRDSPSPSTLRAGAVDQVAQVGDVALEGGAAGGGQRNAGAGLAVREVLLDLDVAGVLEGREMGAEVAVGRLEQRLQAGKLDLVAARQGVQGRHDLQPQRLVDDLVGAHGSDPPQPETAEDQGAAADQAHVERVPF